MSSDTATISAEPLYAKAEDAAVALARAMKNVSFYDVSHPVVGNVIEELLSHLGDLLAVNGEFAIKLIDGYVVVGGKPFLRQQDMLGNLVGACHRRGVDSIVFRRGVRLYDVEQFVSTLATDPAAVEEAGGMTPALTSNGVQHIAVEHLSTRKRSDWRWLHACALDAIRGASAGVRSGQPVDIAGLKLSVREIVDDILGEGTILYNLNSMKGMDEYTFVHALHICILAVELGRRVHFDEAQLEELGVATLLHDVGKIFVPLEVLRKPARLDDSEFAVISRHPVDGAIALARETGVPEVAAVVAFEHHVHIDHSGYPRLRRPRPLHMYSLMASIADVYDALTTARPYRPPLPPLQAVEVLRKEYSSRLEPRLLRHFLAMLGPYPCGTLVGLSDDRMAVVTRPNAMAPDNPFARIIERNGPAHRMADAEVPLRDLAPDPASLTTLDPVTLGMDLAALLHSSIPGSAIPRPGASALT